MEAVVNNPFRILALPNTATDRQIIKRAREMKLYFELGKEKQYKDDLKFLPSPKRSLEAVEDAIALIERPENRLVYSLYWFWENNIADQIAFDLLRENRVDEAERTLRKKVGKEQNSFDVYSNLLNLSVIQLGLCNQNGNIDLKRLEKGIKACAALLQERMLSRFVTEMLGEKAAVSLDKITDSYMQHLFNILQPLLGETQGIQIKELVRWFNEYPKTAKRKVTARFIDPVVRQVKVRIQDAERNRGNDPANANTIAIDLSNETQSDIKILLEALGTDNLRFQVLADNLAREIVSCALVYYRGCQERQDCHQPEEESLLLMYCADDIARGSSIKNDISEHIEALEVNRIYRICEELARSAATEKSVLDIRKRMDAVEDLVQDSISHLRKIKNKLGADDGKYISLSRQIVYAAMSIAAEYFKNTMDLDRVVNIFDQLEEIDMPMEVRKNFDLNRQTLNMLTKPAPKSFPRDPPPLSQAALPPLSQVVQHEFEATATKIKAFLGIAQSSTNKSEKFKEAENLVRSSISHLEIIKTKIGSYDNQFLLVSNTVVALAMSTAVQYANETKDYLRVFSLMEKLSQFEMQPETKTHFEKNIEIIRTNIRAAATNANQSTSVSHQSSTTESSGSSAGCIVFVLIAVAALLYFIYGCGSAEGAELELISQSAQVEIKTLNRIDEPAGDLPSFKERVEEGSGSKEEKTALTYGNKEQIQKLNDDVEEILQKVESLRSGLIKINQLSQEMEARTQKNTEEIGTVSSDQDHLNRKINTIQNDILDIKKPFHLLEKMATSNQENLVSLEKAIVDHQEAMVVMDNMAIQNQKGLETVTNTIISLAKDRDELVSDLKTLQADLQKTDATLKNATQKMELFSDRSAQEVDLINSRLDEVAWLGIICLVLIATVAGFGIYRLNATLAQKIRKLREQLETLGTDQTNLEIQSEERVTRLLETQSQVLQDLKDLNLEKSDSSEEGHDLGIVVGNELYKMQKRLEKLDSNPKGVASLRYSMKRLTESLEDAGYEIVNLEGQPYIEGMRLEAQFYVSEELADGERIITKVIKPQVNFKGVLVQPSTVEIGVGG